MFKDIFDFVVKLYELVTGKMKDSKNDSTVYFNNHIETTYQKLKAIHLNYITRLNIFLDDPKFEELRNQIDKKVPTKEIHTWLINAQTEKLIDRFEVQHIANDPYLAQVCRAGNERGVLVPM